MREKILKIKAGIFVLANLFITCAGISSEVSKVDVPKDYSENFEVKGYEKNVYEYDLNNDGAKEKIVVNYKLNNLEIEDVYSIYTQQNGEYKLTYQITFDKKNDVLDLKEVKGKIDLVKKYFNEYSKDPQANEVRYVKIVTDNRNDDIDFSKIKYKKNGPDNLDNFLFIKRGTAMKTAPNDTAQNLASLGYKEKPKILFEIEKNGQKWYYTELTREKTEVTKDANGKKVQKKIKEPTIKGFIKSQGDNVSERGFYWDKMVEKIETFNKFIEESKNSNQELHIITEYKPLTKDVYSKADKFGNRENQSVRGYVNPDKKGSFINIPDQTIFRILGEEKGMLKIETPFYGGPYYVEKTGEVSKKIEIDKVVNKFIAIDPDSQNEVLFQRNPETGKYEVMSYSFVTTGKDDGVSSYATPHGAFLVSFTRPYMLFTRHARPGDKVLPGRPDLAIGGQARYAVRFSGGAYLHGIPVNTGAGEGAKAYTASKIGTYRESHKCVRHYDDQIEYIVNWINGNSKEKEGDNTIPEENTVVIVL